MTYKNLMTEAQRAEVISKLAELAPDDILLSTLYDVKMFRERVMVDLTNAALSKPKPAVKDSVPKTSPQFIPKAAPNIIPPGESAQRLAPKITSDILSMLAKQPLVDEDIAEGINSSLENTKRYLRTMCERKMIVFDGFLYNGKR